MNDLLNDPKLHSALVTGIVGSGVALVRWLVKREIARNDQRIAAVEIGLANTVKRNEFDQLRRDLHVEHKENLDRFRDLGERVDASATGTHARIDKLFELLGGKP